MGNPSQTQDHPTPDNGQDSRHDNTWRKITAFGIAMGIIWVVFSALIIANGGDIRENLGYAAVLIFSPMVVSLLVNLAYERNLRGFGWRWQNTKLHLVSYLVPILYVAVSYGLVMLLGLGAFDMDKVRELGWVGLIMIPTLGLTGVVFEVIGEEVGWRGFLLPQLMRKLDFTRASLIVGAVWALFHYPLLLAGSYNTGETPILYSLVCFTIAIMGANMAINWLYAKSRSLWTSVIFHTTHNSLLNDLHPLIISTGITWWLITEFGIVLALALGLVGFWFWTKRDELPTRAEWVASHEPAPAPAPSR